MIPLFLLLLSGVALVAQDNNSGKDAAEFFSGTVLEYTTVKITVSRAVLGKPAEKRTFLITPQTKVEGRLRARVRVTVRFKPAENGDVATSILVRAQTQPKKK